MTRLNPEILKKIIKNSGLAENTVRKEISLLKRKYPRCTSNAVAQLFATKYGFSVLQKLSKEDKETLPNHEIEKVVVKLNRKKVKTNKKILELIKYETDDPFQKGHIDEINRAYTMKCYTSAYILSRKVIENLILDILRIKFPQNTLSNKELYYDIHQKRYKDFNIILKNLYEKRHDFHVNSVRAIARLYEKAKKFKDKANDTTHSWFYLVTKKKEIDDLDIEAMINLIKHIEKEL